MSIKKILILILALLNLKLNSSDVCFTQVAGSPFATGSVPLSISFSQQLSTGNVFAGVVNNGNNNVSVYQVNTSTGSFTSVVGSPFATGINPQAIAFSQQLSTGNVFAGVVNNTDNNISVYQVNTTTGSFTPVAGSPFAAGTGPQSISFSEQLSTGNVFAAVINQADNNISVYQVNTTTGSFTPVAGSPFATGNAPRTIAFTEQLSTGNVFAATVNIGDNTASVYQVNTTTGSFTPVAGSPFATGNAPLSIAFSQQLSTGNVFAGVVNNTDNNISVYQVNTTTGSFTPVVGSPFATGLGPQSVAFSQQLLSGNVFAGVVNNPDNNVTIFQVNPTTGNFSPITGSPFATGNGPFEIAFSQQLSTQNLFAGIVNSADNTVSVFSLSNLAAPTLTSATPDCSGILNVVGSAGANNTINIIADGVTTIGMGVADASGNFNFNTTTALSAGLHSITATQTDACDTSPASTPLNVNVLSIPAAPTLISATPDCSGILNVVGTAGANNTITIIADGSTTIGMGVADGSGNFDFDTTTVLSVGSHAITATQTNVCGTSPASTPLNVNVSSIPGAPTLTNVTSNCSGILNVVGTADANNTITIIADGSTTIGSGVADGSGNFNFNTTTGLSSGTHTITATQTNVCGTSPASTPFDITIIPGAPILSSVTENPTMLLTVKGNAQPNSLIKVFADNNQQIGFGTANSVGAYSITTTTLLSAGIHSITVNQTISGCQSVKSNKIDINQIIIIFPLNDSTITTSQPTFIGKVEPNSTVSLTIDNRFVGSTKADSQGNYSIIVRSPLANGEHTATITATVGSITTSITITFTVSAASPCLDTNDDFIRALRKKYG